MITLTRLRLLIALVLLLALAPIEAAWAHAQLLSTEPAQNALLDTAPDTIALHFNEPVSPLVVKLIGPDGASTDLLEATRGGAILIVAPPLGPVGTYVLSYRVVSTDGHAIGGSLVFSVGATTGGATVDPETGGAASLALWAGKVVVFIVMFIGIGGVLFSSLVPLPRQARQICLSLSALGLLIAPVTLGLQGLDALGLPLAAVSDARIWSAGLSTSYGATALALMAAFAGALLSLLLPSGGGAKMLGTLAAILAALSLSLSGHASAAAPQWLTRPAVFLHIAALLFWLGALLPLWMVLIRRSDTADAALARFSKIIPFAIAPLVLSGMALAIIQLGPIGLTWLSSYGAILLAKLALLIVLFALALWNRQRLTEPALAGDVVARDRLRRSIGWELVIVLIILGLVAAWRFTPPPRSLGNMPQSVAAEPLMVHLMGDDLMAMVMIAPGSSGPVVLDIQLTDHEGVPVTAQDVGVTLSSPQLGVEAITRSAINQDGDWQIADLIVPLAGVWHLELDIRLSRFALVKLQTQLTIAQPDSNRRPNMQLNKTLSALLAALTLSAATPSVAEETTSAVAEMHQAAAPIEVGDIEISGAFTRATLPNAPVGGGFFSVTNKGTVDDRLVSVTADFAAAAQLHEMKVENDLMKMRQLTDGIAVPAGETVTLSPGGLHLMFMQLKAPLVEGNTVSVTLNFDKAGTVQVDLPVAGAAADAPMTMHTMGHD